MSVKNFESNKSYFPQNLEASIVGSSLHTIRRVKRQVNGIESKLKRHSDRLTLLSQLPKNSYCAEIGTWKGMNASTILRLTRPEKLYLIDPYRYVPELKRAAFGGKLQSQDDMDEIYNNVTRRFESKIQSGQVEMLRMTSEAASQEFADGSLEWVYVDGDHRYESVKQDLEICSRVVMPGGYIAGDDYNSVGWWEDGVTKAVNEFAETENCKSLQTWGVQYLIELS